MKRKGTLHELYFVITPRKVQPILGKDACEKLNIIKRVNLIQNPDKNNVLSAYKDLFTGIGCVPGRVSIKLKHEAVPVIEACRKILFTVLNEMKTELDRMEETRVIKRIIQPIERVSAMHIVHKPDGKLRICLDARNLTKAILSEHLNHPQVRK